ncbi:MAG: TrmH family RNA methyltransferase [Propionibacteriaceae bacterium]
MADLISSRTNPLVKRIRTLSDRKYRKREKVFFVEGLQSVWRAVESGCQIETLVVAPELLLQPESLAMVEQERARGVNVAEVTADIFAALSDRDGPTGLAAIVAIPQQELSELDVPRNGIVMGLERIANPGNLGTIVRAADASGVTAIVLMGECTDPWSPAAVKASMGSIFAVPVVNASAVEALTWAGENKLRVLATSGYADKDLWDVDLTGGTFVLFGNEGEGLRETTLASAHGHLRIPMVGTAESLNLSVAASIVAFEAARQLRSR